MYTKIKASGLVLNLEFRTEGGEEFAVGIDVNKSSDRVNERPE